MTSSTNNENQSIRTAFFHPSNIIYSLIVIASIVLYIFVLPTPKLISQGHPLPFCSEAAFQATPQDVSARMQHFSNATVISALRESYRDKWIHLIGDSTLRDTYYELSSLLNRKGVNAHIDDAEVLKRNLTRHKAQQSRIGSSKVTFAWAPFLANATDQWMSTMKGTFKPNMVVFSLGLHDLLYSNTDQIQIDLDKLSSTLSTSLMAEQHPDVKTVKDVPSILFQTSQFIIDDMLTDRRKEAVHFRADNVKALNSKISAKLRSSMDSPKFTTVDAFDLTQTRPSHYRDDGIHSQYSAAASALSIAAASSCHFGTPPFYLSSGQLTLALFTLGLVFIMLYTAVSAVLSSKIRPTKAVSYSALPTSEVELVETEKDHDKAHSSNSSNGSAAAVDSKKTNWSLSLTNMLHLDHYFSSETSSVLVASLQLSLVLLFMFVIDSDHRLAWQLIGDKNYVRDTLAFVVLMLAGISAYTWKSSEVKAVILNRDQTEEWKGWMQLLFVLYHYFAAKELYNVIRVFIAAYVFMTGYGNFLFFQRFGDYSFVRLAKMLFRLNFFVAVVCMAMDREYMQYYVCALHTTFFLFVYLVMYIGSQRNNQAWFMALKFIGAFVALVLIFDVPKLGLFDLLFDKFALFYWKNSLHEWRFRSTLDHFATFAGMLFAWQIHRLDAFYQWLEKCENKQIKYFVTAVVVGAILVVFGSWARYLLFIPKGPYNAHNPYTSFIPIIAYVLLRNWTSYLRNRHLAFFAYFGKITLETYILQFHVWLSDDAATLVFYTGSFNWPLVNFLIASAIYVTLAQYVFKITVVISDALIPAKASAPVVAANLIKATAVLCGVFVVAQSYLLMTR